MEAFSVARTWSRPSASAPMRCCAVARMPMAWPPLAKPVWPALEILRADVERTLKLLGCPSVATLDRSYVELAARFWPAHS
jgi:isopentenyl diphosphate isomerase/L-lactate dehydrogenase-like FMN-dependent dehydrogenase